MLAQALPLALPLRAVANNNNNNNNNNNSFFIHFAIHFVLPVPHCMILQVLALVLLCFFSIYSQLFCYDFSATYFQRFCYGFTALHIFPTVLLYTYFPWFLVCFYSFRHISNCFCLFYFWVLNFSSFFRKNPATNAKSLCLCESPTFFQFFLDTVFPVFLFLHKSPMFFAMFLLHIFPRKKLWFHISTHISNCFAMFFACGL